ncbi:MAG: lamin tail domain-containing protein [Verrucomicrobiota bacterium]
MKNAFVSLLAFLPLIARAEVVINEVHSNSPADRPREEFVELFNKGAESIDLSGWRFDEGIRFIFSEGVMLAPGAYLVVAQEPDRALFEGVARVFGPYEGQLQGDGEEVSLVDRSGEEVDRVDYRVGSPWPTVSDGDGPSMELVHPSLDNDLGSSWRPSDGEPTPGRVNSVRQENPAPNIRQVRHVPKAPTSVETVTITAKITDADGMGEVMLHYQDMEAGHYIPAYSPVPRTSLLANPEQPRRLSSGYAEGLFTGFWDKRPMVDDGTNGDALAMDGIYTIVLPALPNRSLFRYYIKAKDVSGEEVRAPMQDDPSLNYAWFVYDGVPEYAPATSVQGDGHVYSREVLESLPVYHLLVRSEDWEECIAYSGGDQHPREAMDARRAYNWSGTIVYGDEVYDNISFRLRGGNGRYHLRGKRSMKFRFNKGRYFEVRNNRGEPYPEKWRVLTTSKMYGNRNNPSETFGTRRGPGNFGLVDSINGQLWRLFKVPAAHAHWFHFRVIDGEEEAPDQYAGDFYGLNLALERFDSRFLRARGMPKGNLYKLTDRISNGKEQQRYQAPDAVQDASDYLNIKNQLRANKEEDWLNRHVNWDNWYRYTAVEEAVRHYDYWPTADKNMVYYFEPAADPEEKPLGIFWQLPYDSDATWGPSWNNGEDIPGAAVARKEPYQIGLRNAIRGFRDLIWREEVLSPMLDDLAAVIRDFYPADRDRWNSAPTSEGREDFGPMETKVTDMLAFAFEGNLSYPGGSVGNGGRAAWLDDLAMDSAVPRTPSIDYDGPDTFPVDQLSFVSTGFRKASLFVTSNFRDIPLQEISPEKKGRGYLHKVTGIRPECTALLA